MDNFKIENKDGYSVITMSAERLDGQTTPQLRSELVLLAGNQVSNMILDLSSCNYCDTNGLSAIMIAHRLCKNGSLVLVGVNDEVQSILSIQNFDPKLNIEANVGEAEKFITEVLASK
ncbi:MAG: STAS domain-containing protein [Bacteroidales bacterium]|nr:STAS domain-containing protein [Bacteroidales bacterium]